MDEIERINKEWRELHQKEEETRENHLKRLENYKKILGSGGNAHP